MIDSILTSISNNLDRIADAMERIASQQGDAVNLARLQAVERKVEAIADPAPPSAEPAPVAAAAPEPAPVAKAAAVTHDDVRGLAKELIAAKGTKVWKQVLADAGAETVSALPAEKLGDVAAAIKTLLP